MTTPDDEIIEAMARAAHTAFMRSDRWDEKRADGTPLTAERNKAPWRIEARAQLSELRRRGYEIGRV